MNCLDSLPILTPHQAYAAMLEFLRIEFELSDPTTRVILGGLLSEMQLEPDGSSADPGAMMQFRDAVAGVLARGVT